MLAIKDSNTFCKALVTVFCCTILISQSGRLFAEDKEDKTASQPKSAAPTPQAPSKQSEADGAKAKGADAEDNIPPLAEMLATALENNPDIGVAVSQVQAAESQLKQTQLNVVQQVMELREAWHAQVEIIRSSQSEVENTRNRTEHLRVLRLSARVEYGTILEAETQENAAAIALIQAQAKLAETKAKITYVLGVQNLAFEPGGAANVGDRGTPAANGPASVQKVMIMPASARESAALSRLKIALEENTQLDVISQPLTDVMAFLKELHNIDVLFDSSAFAKQKEKNADWDGTITLRTENASLGAVLQMIMDLYPDVSFVVRDYGLFVTVKGNEPAGAMSVADFIEAKPSLITTRRGYTTAAQKNSAPTPSKESGDVKAKPAEESR